MGNLYGTPQFILASDSTDRYAVRRTRFSIEWTTNNDSALVAASGRPQLPTFKDAKLVGIGTVPKEPGSYLTWFDFESIDLEVLPMKDRDHSPEFRFTGDMAEVDIKLYPNFQTLLDQFGGTILPDGTVDWSPTLQGSAPSVGIGGSSTGTQPNSMYGIQSWYRQTGLYVHRYAAKTLPAEPFNRIGKVLKRDQLPGSPPPSVIEKGSNGEDVERDYLCRPPQYENLANGFSIAEPYWMSGPGGWPEAIYPPA